MMSRNESEIMKYARVHGQFTKDELFAYLSEMCSITESSLSWYLSVLTKQHQLARIGYGVYSAAQKNEFTPTPSENILSIYEKLRVHLPFADFCLYEGTVITSLQHHLSPNNITYIETNRNVTETVFNLLKEEGETVYINPSIDIIYRYVDMGKSGIYVKTMITESPLQTIKGVPCPTIEKLLVDICSDEDFFYLQGAETNRIIENAYSLYHINKSRLKRYASRRGFKEEMIALIGNYRNL